MSLADEIFAIIRQRVEDEVTRQLDAMSVTGDLRHNIRPLIVALVIQQAGLEYKRVAPMVDAWMAEVKRGHDKDLATMTSEMQRKVGELVALHTEAQGRG